MSEQTSGVKSGGKTGRRNTTSRESQSARERENRRNRRHQLHFSHSRSPISLSGLGFHDGCVLMFSLLFLPPPIRRFRNTHFLTSSFSPHSICEKDSRSILHSRATIPFKNCHFRTFTAAAVFTHSPTKDPLRTNEIPSQRHFSFCSNKKCSSLTISLPCTF